MITNISYELIHTKPEEETAHGNQKESNCGT